MNNIVRGFSQLPNWAIFTPVQRLIPILVFSLVVAACGSAATESGPGADGIVATTVASEPGDTSGPSTTTGSDSSSSPTTAPTDGAPAATTAPTAVTTNFDGAAAPDFRLALADGSDFVLSEETKPVYMVFWAEW